MMNSNAVLLIAVALVIAIQTSVAQTPASASQKVTKGLALYTPQPEYHRGWPEGSCVVAAYVDQKSGNVVRAEISKSTGYKILDDSAMQAVCQWRFAPGKTASVVRIPMSFVSGYKARLIEQEAQRRENARGPMPADAR